MKYCIFPLLLFMMSSTAQRNFDSLQYQLHNAKDDTLRIRALSDLAWYYSNIRIDSSLFYARQAIDRSEKKDYSYGKFLGYQGMTQALNSVGDYPKALEMALKGLRIAEGLNYNRQSAMAKDYFLIGALYRIMGDTSKAFINLREAIKSQEASGESISDISLAFTQLSLLYQKNYPDSFLFYAQKGYDLALQSKKYKGSLPQSIAILGNAWEAAGNYFVAKTYYYSGIQQSKNDNNLYILARIYNNLAGLYSKTGNLDSAIYYAHVSLKICKQYNYSHYALDASEILTKIYESEHKSDSILKYTRVMLAVKDSLFSRTKMLQFELLGFDEQQRKQQLKAAEAEYRSQLKIYGLLAGLFGFLLIAFILWRNNLHKQKAYTLLQKQNQEIDQQKEKVESTLAQVKALQTQLVEKEKINERLRISRELHDDIGSTLSGIVLYSHLAEDQIQAKHSDEVEQSLNVIQQSANEMVNRLNDIVWAVDPGHNSLKNLLQKLEEYATEMATVKNIKVSSKVPESLPELQLPVEMLHNIYLLCKEAINNAVKYSHASFLELSVHHLDDIMEFTIRDNGKGFDMATAKKGNGLMNMQKRADEIGAKLCMKSIPLQGTVILLQCSVGKP